MKPRIVQQPPVPGPPLHPGFQQDVFPPGISGILPQFSAPGMSGHQVPPGPPLMMRPLLPPGLPPMARDDIGPQKPSHIKSVASTFVKRPLAQHTPQMDSCYSLSGPCHPPHFVSPQPARFISPYRMDSCYSLSGPCHPPHFVPPQHAHFISPHRMDSCYSLSGPCHPPHFVSPQPARFISPYRELHNPGWETNQAHDSVDWGEKAREWVAAQSPDASVTCDYDALLGREDLVFPIQIPMRAWMKEELAKMSTSPLPSTTKKKGKVNVSADLLLDILGLIGRFNPDKSPHKYEVSPSKLVSTSPPLTQPSQAPPPPSHHPESNRNVEFTKSTYVSYSSRHKRHSSFSVDSGQRSKRPKLGEG